MDIDSLNDQSRVVGVISRNSFISSYFEEPLRTSRKESLLVMGKL